jgi:hypothetical protein
METEGGQKIHLSSITLCNFQKIAETSPWDEKNGAEVYFDGNVSIISNTISGGGGSFDQRSKWRRLRRCVHK